MFTQFYVILWCHLATMSQLVKYWQRPMPQIDGLVQERRNSSVLAVELSSSL